MPNPYHSEHPEPHALTPGGIKAPDKRPGAKPAGGSSAPWKMPKTPGPGRRVHKVLGRRVRQMAREDY